MSRVRSLDTGRLDDVHSQLDEALSKGARAIAVLAVYDAPVDESGAWEMWWNGQTSCAERAFIHQQGIVIEISRQEIETE